MPKVGFMDAAQWRRFRIARMVRAGKSSEEISRSLGD
jgi:hypothetical protein